MNTQSSELLEKIRQQFEGAPYPRVSPEKSPKDDKNFNQLYLHSLVTPFYLRNQQVVDPKGKLILDAGCGSGYKSLVLAEANPGARIVGIDLSEQSVKLAEKRLRHHGFEENVEFHVLQIEELTKLGMEFDYINCDEVLYLFPDIAAVLSSFKSVLKPTGIIRSNLHNKLQRQGYFRAQEAFRLMGLTEENPGELEVGLVIETMKALHDVVEVKAKTWQPDYAKEQHVETILMNFLFQGDKGYGIPELFAALETANLEFTSMTNWRHWELTDLFIDPDDLPMFLALSLPGASIEERLHLFNLLHPIHRLIDFWCSYPEQMVSFNPITEWDVEDWRNAQIHLHPQLKRTEVKQELNNCLNKQKPFEISQYIPVAVAKPVYVDSYFAACCLLPLWEGPQPMMELVNRWLKVRSYDPISLEPISEVEGFEQVRTFLSKLEAFLYILVQAG
ncbi:class I SAM-dependent methyltransferase [Cyanobacteria bacterium FACHB-471]|nr:class I SAM-dependent methyltransferase [Cyanobacteria bacterium FACHB-471]